MLAVGMNGEPLPLEHGFPVRMVVPGLYGYVSATKWLVDLEVTRFADFKAYWTTRGYSVKAPIKTSSRIDVPKSFAQVKAGDKIAVAGVAWAQDRGIKKVEVRVDGGAWQEARLADAGQHRHLAAVGLDVGRRRPAPTRSRSAPPTTPATPRPPSASRSRPTGPPAGTASTSPAADVRQFLTSTPTNPARRGPRTTHRARHPSRSPTERHALMRTIKRIAAARRSCPRSP